MSMPLFLMMLKKNWVTLLAVTGFILMEMSACIFMFDQIDGLNFFGIGGDGILAFVESVLPLIGVIFPMVFYVYIIFRLVFKPVDGTSLNSYLSAGVKRTTYLLTAMVFVVASLITIFTVVYFVCGLSMLYWGAIDWAEWLRVVMGVMLANIAVSAIAFAIAAAFSPTNIAKGGIIGVPATLLVMTMISTYLEIFKWVSVFMWVDFKLWGLVWAIYVAIAVAAYVVGIFVFRRKQLPI